MNYTLKSFAVASPGTEEYARRWEETFRASEPDDTLPTPKNGTNLAGTRTPKVTCARCSVTFDDFDGYRSHECAPSVPDSTTPTPIESN
jgi:hypothetical protein